MKVAIISDLHLGFRQYGSMEREEDFYRQFFNVCKEIKEHKPEIVIIAGDTASCIIDLANIHCSRARLGTSIVERVGVGGGSG